MNGERNISKITPDDVTIWVTQSAKSDLFEQFFAKRAAVFVEYGMKYYSPHGDEYDNQPDTVFLTVIDKETHTKVLGGLSLVFHLPGTDNKLPAEKNTHTTVQEMMPHLDTHKLCYVEIKGIFLDTRGHGEGIAKDMWNKAYEVIQQMKADFVVVLPVPDNYRPAMKAASFNKVQQFVVRKDVVTIEDGDWGPTLLFSHHGEDVLQLLSKEMKERGIGLPMTEDVEMVSWRARFDQVNLQKAA